MEFETIVGVWSFSQKDCYCCHYRRHMSVQLLFVVVVVVSTDAESTSCCYLLFVVNRAVT